MRKKVFVFFASSFVCLAVLGQSGAPLVHDNGNILELNNGMLNIAFKRDDGFNLYWFSTIANNKSWVSSSGMRDALWILTIQHPEGAEKEFNSSSPDVDYKGFEVTDSLGLKASVNFTWKVSLPDTAPFNVYVTVNMLKRSALTEWDFKADLPKNYKAIRLVFPQITFLKTDEVSKLILPMGFGAEYNISTTATTYVAPYPSSRATVQLMCMHEGGEALYYATHDAEANSKTFKVITNTATTATFFTDIETSMAWTTSDGKFTLPWKTSLGAHPKGWTRAVKEWYRPFSFQTVWGKTKLQDRPIPEWFLKKDLWITTNVADGIDNLIKRSIQYFGAESTVFNAYYWHHYPFDTYLPEYFPPQSIFLRIKKQIHSAGCYVVPYINGRLWDSTTDYFVKKNASNSAVQRKSGSIVTEVYGGVPSAVMCPSTGLWKNTLLDISKQLFDTYSVDGIYYDQIASAQPYACWNPDHDHPSGGGDFWVKSYRDIMATIRSSWNSEQIYTTEQNAECYLDIFDGLFMTNRPLHSNYTLVPLFQYIYSDRALLYGVNVFNSNNISILYKSAINLLWGSQIGSYQAILIMDWMPVEYRSFIRTLVSFRGQNRDIFIGGELMEEFIPLGDNPVASIPDYGTSNVVLGSKWKNINGQEAILLVNFDKESREVLVDGIQVKMEKYSCKRINMPILPKTPDDNSFESNKYRVYAINNTVYIHGMYNKEQYMIFNTAGQLLRRGHGSAIHEETIALNPGGVYIVSVVSDMKQRHSYKVLVR